MAAATKYCAQADDGCVVLKGTIAGEPAVIVALEAGFQAGSMGEVSGAKMTAALDFAARDSRNGTKTAAVLLLETGGVRLQEANLGRAAIAEITASILALRQHAPVITVIARTVGCFGGMSLAPGLSSYIIVTPEARLGLDGAEVIEQESGIEEFDSSGRALVWAINGGVQRVGMGVADELVSDDAPEIAAAVKRFVKAGVPAVHRSEQVELYRQRIASIDASRADRAAQSQEPVESGTRCAMSQPIGPRGKAWFKALTGKDSPMQGDPGSVLAADARLGEDDVRFLCVVPNPQGRFPCARHGEVGLEEAYTLAARIREAMEQDQESKKRPIVVIVDVKSQAYGRREGTAAIFLAAAAATDAYASARMKGHPVISLVVGQAISGAFLTHGYQANRILAFDDPGVVIHAMHKEAAARITLRSVEELDRLGHEIPPLSYDIRDYAKLGLLHKIAARRESGRSFASICSAGPCRDRQRDCGCKVRID